jgi:hypothetical protein
VSRVDTRGLARSKYGEVEEPGRVIVPGQRALHAMAEAVQRARELTESNDAPLVASPPCADSPSTEVSAPEARMPVFEDGQHESEPTSVPTAGGGEPTQVTRQPRPEPTRLYPPAPPPAVGRPEALPAPEPRPAPPRRPRPATSPLRWAVVAVGAVVIILSVVVIVLNTKSHSPAVSSTPTVTTARPSSSGTAPTRPSSGPVAKVPAAPGSAKAPELISLAPAQGSAGQTVTVSGSNLFSGDGYVQASFDTQAAPTSCSSQTTCTVVVPMLSGFPRDVQVTVTTETGTSNAMTFYYG